MLRRTGSSWGFGALLEDTSVMVLRVEKSAGYSLQLQKKLREYILCAKKNKNNLTLLNYFVSAVSVFDERITNKNILVASKI